MLYTHILMGNTLTLTVNQLRYGYYSTKLVIPTGYPLKACGHKFKRESKRGLSFPHVLSGNQLKNTHGNPIKAFEYDNCMDARLMHSGMTEWNIGVT
jgi:hypothetical protein